MKELESKRIAKAEEVLEYLTRVLRGEETEQVVFTENIGDFMIEAKVVDKEISAKDKTKAAELLGKRYRLFVDKVEKDSKINVNSTTKLDSILNQLKDDDNE
nr:MAG TPA_asm: Terminase small subunit [Caudoviricetes sp.]